MTLERSGAVIETALDVLRNEVAPRAQEMDLSREALGEGLDALARRDLLALKRPERWGGPAVSNPEFTRFQVECARASGALAFLQTQHQSAVRMIATGENDELKDRLLPKMGDGRELVGIGFSQLRRPGPPLVRATAVPGGYRVDGHVPWCTGAGFFPRFLLGAERPDGTAVFGVVPLADGPGVRVSEPMRLAAMETATTVTVDFDGYLLPEADVAFTKPQGWIRENDELNIALQGAFAMGCALAGLDVLRDVAARRPAAWLRDAADALAAEWREVDERAELLRRDTSPDSREDRLTLRADQIALCLRCAHAAVTASAGAANALTHPAQRIYREALVYTVSAQTSDIMRATLARTVGRPLAG